LFTATFPFACRITMLPSLRYFITLPKRITKSLKNVPFPVTILCNSSSGFLSS
jgi:hypothetical protein